jgi:hypothetical protein
MLGNPNYFFIFLLVWVCFGSFLGCLATRREHFLVNTNHSKIKNVLLSLSLFSLSLNVRVGLKLTFLQNR